VADAWSTNAESRTAGASGAEDETIALLEEEIARLETELRLRDLAAAAEIDHAGTDQPRPGPDPGAQERIAQLEAELAARAETIGLLLEQLRLADEAEAASHAEWEQLHGWVEELERRVAERGDGEPDPELRAALEAEQRNSDLLRHDAEKAERSWELQRQALVAEVERLRGRFTEVAGQSDTTVAVVAALEHENRELRDAYDALARTTVSAHEADVLMRDLQITRQKYDALAHELQKERDERQRERKEYEASSNALKSQLARDSLRRQEEQVKAASHAPTAKDPLLDADMRIRAFREHLKEIEQGEAQERMRRSLAARLSRLWNHTK
jgi:hypothetical protein